MFVTRICQNVKINSVEANQGSYRARSEGWMQTPVQKSKGKFAGKRHRCASYTYNICPCMLQRKFSDAVRSDGLGRSGRKILILIKKSRVDMFQNEH